MQYEYKIIEYYRLMDEESLSLLGSEGWKLVTIVYDGEGWFGRIRLYYHFMRSIDGTKV